MVSRPANVAGAGAQPGRKAHRRAGLRVLVPGAAQWSWRQRERAAVFFGSFATALLVGLFTWGTKTSAAILVFAFGMHVASAADAIRQGAFPGFGRWVPTVSASVGLGLGCYAPALALASVLAWPGLGAGDLREGFLINRWAYGSSEPSLGHWIWFEPSDGRGYGVAEVVAGPGQGVDWADGSLTVDGRESPWKPARSTWPPNRLSFTVPDGHVLIGAMPGSGQSVSCGFVLLPRERIAGRAWARMYPVWARKILL
jgi:hypothetical protein